MKKTFFSYSRQDGTEIADYFFTRFHNAGYDVVMDRRHLELGSEFERELLSQIKQCDILFVFLTNSARSSPWVAKEIQVARDTNTLIVPICCDCDPLPKDLQSLESLHLKEKEDWWRIIHRLGTAMDDPAAPKPRAVNLSPHDPQNRSGLLVLNAGEGRPTELNSPEAVAQEAERLANLALPMIRDAQAGVIPPSHASLLSAFLAILFGKQNQLPKLYWSHTPTGETGFHYHHKVALNLQHVREQARGERRPTPKT